MRNLREKRLVKNRVEATRTYNQLTWTGQVYRLPYTFWFFRPEIDLLLSWAPQINGVYGLNNAIGWLTD